MTSQEGASGNPSRGVREAIQLLSAILANSCSSAGTRVPSETFRQAKFNQPQAAPALWSLLALCLQLVRFLDSPERPAGELRSHVHYQSFERSRTDQLKHTAFVVRKRLHAMGYSKRAFYSTDCERVDSRELLLALGWLLHRGCLFQKLTAYHLREAACLRVPLKPKQSYLLDCAETEISQFSSELKLLEEELAQCSMSQDSQALSHSLHKLAWLRGRASLSWRTVSTARSSYQKLAASLSASMGPGPSRSLALNVHQLFLLRYPDRLSSYMKKLEWHVVCLQQLIEWSSRQGNYWRWMESVLDLQKRERTEREEEEGKERGLRCGEETSSVVDCSEPLTLGEVSLRVERLHQEVASLLEKNKSHVDSIHRAWRAKEKRSQSEMRDASNLKETAKKWTVRLYFHHPCFMSSGAPSNASANCDVEVLNQIDIAACLPWMKPTPARRGSTLPNLASQQLEAATALRLEASQKSLQESQTSLLQMEDVLGQLKEETRQKLYSLQQALPASIAVVLPAGERK